MRVLTYNIHKGIGGRDRKYQLERIFDVIAAADPDFICLQEVDRHVPRSRRHDQPRLFVERFEPASHMFQFNVTLKHGGYGNLLLSRWPIVEHHQISLTLRGRKRRGAQLAEIDTPEGRFQLVNWHLGLVEHERHWQVRRLLEHHLFCGLSHLPTLIAGDTNDWRDTLKDGPFAVHSFSQVTRPLSRFRSFPAYMPMGSLDKAFVRGGIDVTAAHVARSRLARVASDHLPLIVDFSLQSTPLAD